ncbi:condensation domain-containing protein [Streptomyces sp. WAC05374]|uniref:condensation domain-containing protein n=1 Tax=Streptomyces sp. WAC05374 TaxID=2487420 RepID=UPI000F85EF24|nr:condensation domain-containing protein [Streptomyces sp. WAC05374]RST18342.1 peptide synthetase [Streptomyces sp. WAC05374]
MTADESLSVVTSFAQQSLWLQHELDPGLSAYNITAAVRLRGPLDTAALERALNTVVGRHEALRTVFALDGDVPVQVIGGTAPLTVPVTPARPEEVGPVAREVLAEPFDLAVGPLVRLRLLRLEPEHHVALLAMHHIVTDGVSSAILLEELSVAYAAALADAEPPLEELPIQYADFAVWQRDTLTGATLERLTEHWSRTLAGAAPLRLPTARDGAASGADGTGGGTHHFTLPAPLAARLDELARAEGATLFMVLLAAFDALLSRYCAQDDITVVSPMAGRDRPELEGLIGYFVNPLLLRTDLSGDPSFTGLLERVRTGCLDAFDHQELPFEQAVEVLRRRGLPGAEALRSQVMLVLQSARPSTWRSAGIAFELLPVDVDSAKAGLVLDVRPEPGGTLLAALEYADDVFDAAGARRLAEQLAAFLRAAAERPGERLSRLLDETVPADSVPAAREAAGAAGGPGTAGVAGAADEPGVPGRAVAYTAPRTPLEEEVAAIWSSLLGREDIGVHDNFFDLGGQSLVAVRLAARLRDAFGVRLTVRDLYADFTVAATAWTVLERMAAEEPETA